MSAEEAADLLASLADNEPEVASVRRSGRSRRVSVDDNEETLEQPHKRTKKAANASNKHAGASKSDSDLKKIIRNLKKQLANAQSARKAAESAKEEAEKAKKSSNVLVKGQKQKIKALEDVIEGTETGELMGQLKATKRKVATANASTMQALTDKSIAEAKKDLLQKELKDKAKELSDATKEKNKLVLKVGLLEAKLAILEARGKQTRKNRTYASNLTTQ